MKVGIYCRLSEEDRNKKNKGDDSESIQNQKSILIKYAMERDWEIYNIYSDDDYKGSDRNRPEFNKLLRDAEAGKINIILCKTQSRFTRELELVEKYIHGLFLEWGVRFVSIVDNADTANEGNKKARQINGLINEWYLEEVSQNIRTVFKHKREKGIFIGAFAPYGYKKDPENKGCLIIDEETAPIVQEIFELYASGTGRTNIARILNERGLPNPTEHKRQQGFRYVHNNNVNSTLWKYYSVQNILTNEVYIGNMVQGKSTNLSYKSKKVVQKPRNEWDIVEGTHERIISLELWNKVNEICKGRNKQFSTGKRGMFAGKVKCMYCNYCLRSTKSRDKRYFKCETKHVHKGACIGAFISHERLEEEVLKEINQLANMYLDKEQLESVNIGTDFDKEINIIDKNITQYNTNREKYSKHLKSIYIDRVDGMLSDSDFLDLKKELEKERNRIDEAVAELNKKKAELEKKKRQAKGKKDLLEQYCQLESLTHEVIDTLVDYILVGKREKGTNIVPLEIHWNF